MRMPVGQEAEQIASSPSRASLPNAESPSPPTASQVNSPLVPWSAARTSIDESPVPSTHVPEPTASDNAAGAAPLHQHVEGAGESPMPSSTAGQEAQSPPFGDETQYDIPARQSLMGGGISPNTWMRDKIVTRDIDFAISLYAQRQILVPDVTVSSDEDLDEIMGQNTPRN